MKHIHILKLLIALLVVLGTFGNGNAQCFGISANNLTFPKAGGTQQTTIIENCPPGTFTVYNPFSWVTTSVSGNQVTVTVQSNAGQERSVGIAILYNGSTSGGFQVFQDGTPPPPPPSCTVSGFSGSSFASGGESKSYTLSHANCSSQVYFDFTDEQGNPLPSWVNVSQPTLTEVNVSFQANNSGAPRSVIIVGARPDGQSGGIGGSFSQNCAVKVWYTDSDGDGFRDPGSTPEEDCANRGTGWTQSTTVDRCPDIPEPSNDCGPRIITGNNYVYARTYQEQHTTAVDPQFFTQNDILTQTITYYDGLGRPMQKVGIGHTPGKGDVVTHIGYDSFGRVEKEWLPYADPDSQAAIGGFRSDAETATDTYYGDNYPDDILLASPNPYFQKTFETSPLNRILQQAAPGSDWAKGSGHEIEFGYHTNTAADNVRLFTVGTSPTNNTYVPILELDTDPATNRKEFFGPNELYKTITYDENHTNGKNHSVEEFMDKQGRILLKRTFADITHNDQSVSIAVPHDTYYVYDDFGNLSYVLPPKMEGTTATLAEINGAMAELGYQYVYDHHNRLVEKQLPGKGREYIVYNTLDQPIMTQDANQRAANNPNLTTDEWLFTKYDAFGRVAYTGKATSPAGTSRIDVQDQADAISGFPWVEQKNTNRDSEFGEALDIYYNNGAYPNETTLNPKATLTEVLTITYYDSYVNLPSGAPGSITLLGSNPPQSQTSNVQGLPTVARVKVLDVPGTNVWINTLTYYDDKGRPIYTYSKNNYLGTTDITETQLNFVGRALKTRTTHTRLGNTLVTLDNFDYDHMGRLLNHTQCIGDGTLGESCNSTAADTSLIFDIPVTSSRTDVAKASITLRPGFYVVATPGLSYTAKIDPDFAQELIAYNDYDALGQLVRKKVGGTPGTDFATTTGLQTVDYSYNIRSWLTGINDVSNTARLFNFKIVYNQGPSPLYNGNIAETEWKTANTDNGLKWYRYTYDPLNRITSATANSSNYTVSGITYDKNGNLQSLTRKGHTNAEATSFGTMDVLDYDYLNSEVSNRLYKVRDDGNKSHGFVESTDDGQDYWYDPNGNMVRDLNKGIGTASVDGITYNHLNLPAEIKFDNDSNKKISYIYDALGTKIQKVANDNSSLTTTDHVGHFVYENGILQFFSHPEGYVTPNESVGYNYIYQYKDHLGNVRLSYHDANGDDHITVSTDPMITEVVEESNYYPFGLKHKGYNDNSVPPLGNSVAQKYKTFQGQEFTEDLGLNIHEWKYRISDPAIGRFWQVDPLAEDYVHNGVYNFSENRVIDGVELEGLEYVSIHHFANGTVSQTEYYKMSNAQIKRLGGTTAGLHNSAAYGPLGKGVVHYYYNSAGEVTDTYSEILQDDFNSIMGRHGLYSGQGSVTHDGFANSTNYDFTMQPIDWGDAIAKRHDEDYAAAAPDNYLGFLEDTRTLQADLDMVGRIDELVGSFLNPFKKIGVSGVDTPFRTSYSTEMDGSLLGQRMVISSLATYKQWKIDNDLVGNKYYNIPFYHDRFAKAHPGAAQVLDLVVGGTE